MMEVIIFDCMETLVEVKEVPDLKLYSSWAYHGSGVEDYWDRFEDFYTGYGKARRELTGRSGLNREYSLFERFEHLVEDRFKEYSGEVREMLIKKLCRNFWDNYQKNCFVDKRVKDTLADLQQRYILGVVSNFMIAGGIEELLKIYGIYQYFKFVVTSIGEGWRKPAEKIYLSALGKAGVNPEDVLFVGDDYICDYQGPRSMGMKSILLDREGNYPGVANRIRHITELKEYKNLGY